MARNVVMGAVAVLIAHTAGAQAQETLLSDLYGRGVHAYFAGNHTQAITHLSSAINQGSQDPRSYYFRGLAMWKQGNTLAAEDDFRNGADLEARAVGRDYGVGRSLQRVQGATRLKLEEFRRDARATAGVRKTEGERATVENRRRGESKVLRNPSRPAPADPPPVPREIADDSDPFNSAQGVAGGTRPSAAGDSNAAPTAPGGRDVAPAGATEPTTPDSTDVTSEDGDDTEASDEPEASDDADPFGNQPAAGEEMSEEEPAAEEDAAGDDAAGDDAPAEADDPFSGESSDASDAAPKTSEKSGGGVFGKLVRAFGKASGADKIAPPSINLRGIVPGGPPPGAAMPVGPGTLEAGPDPPGPPTNFGADDHPEGGDAAMEDAATDDAATDETADPFADDPGQAETESDDSADDSGSETDKDDPFADE